MSGYWQDLQPLAVLSLGQCTPLGLTSRATQAERATGTVRFFQTEVRDRAGEPVKASMLTLLEEQEPRTRRMTAMAVTALRECLGGLPLVAGERVALVLALPEAGSGAPVDEAVLVESLRAIASPVRLEVGAWSGLRLGRAGLFHALRLAWQVLREGRAHLVAVGGVDCLCDEATLRHLARARRTLGRAQRDGLIPGEGAAFLLVAGGPRLDTRATPPLGWVLACTQAEEHRHFLQPEPNLAEGLTEAFHQLRHHPVAGSRRVDLVLSSQTGESFWAEEFDQACLRQAALMPEPLQVDLVAASLGDAGAAAGALQLCHALHRLGRFEPAHRLRPRALVYGCSDSGPVGACVAELPA